MFSQWDDMLDIVEMAFKENQVRYDVSRQDVRNRFYSKSGHHPNPTHRGLPVQVFSVSRPCGKSVDLTENVGYLCAVV